MPRYERFERIVLALAVMFSTATMIGFAFSPPAGPWWWTVAFVDGQLGLLTIWAALGKAPWYLRWPTWLAVLELADLRVHTAWNWQEHLEWMRLPHALLTFTVLCVLRGTGLTTPRSELEAGKVSPLRQFTLTRMFVWVAVAALAAWTWNHRLDFRPRSMWRLLDVGDCALMTAMDIAAAWLMLRPSPIRWRLIWLVVAVMPAQAELWSLSERVAFAGAPFEAAIPWWHHLSHVGLYDVFYLAPIVAALATYSGLREHLVDHNGAQAA